MGFFSEAQVSIERTSGFNLNPCQHYAEMFRTAMAEAGIITHDPIIPDGVLRRIHVDGHRRRTRNGAYILHADGHPAGWFTNWKAGVSDTWRYSGGKWCISAEDQRQIEEARFDRHRERVLRHNQTALQAVSIFSMAAPAESHIYLIRKGVNSYGLKIGSWIKNIQAKNGWLPANISDAPASGSVFEIDGNLAMEVKADEL